MWGSREKYGRPCGWKYWEEIRTHLPYLLEPAIHYHWRVTRSPPTEHTCSKLVSCPLSWADSHQGSQREEIEHCGNPASQNYIGRVCSSNVCMILLPFLGSEQFTKHLGNCGLLPFEGEIDDGVRYLVQSSLFTKNIRSPVSLNTAGVQQDSIFAHSSKPLSSQHSAQKRSPYPFLRTTFLHRACSLFTCLACLLLFHSHTNLHKTIAS